MLFFYGRTVFHGDVNDNQSCVEIADNIREYSRHKSINGNNLTEEKSTRSSCFDQQDQGDLICFLYNFSVNVCVLQYVIVIWLKKYTHPKLYFLYKIRYTFDKAQLLC